MRKIIYVFALVLPFLVSCEKNPGKTKPEKIDYVVQEAFDDREFIGNILVADQGEIIYRKSFGNADQQNTVQNTDTTKYLICSISKPITAILILKLVDQGILNLDDTINKYFINSDSKVGKINIHQLLTHTSGINEIIGKGKNQDVTSLIQKATLKFEPGSDFEYSNSGYVLLKEIAEIATTKSYDELLKAEIFDPINMTSSGVARSSSPTALAKGYADPKQTDIVELDFPIENVDGAGSTYSTVEDLYKLDRALYTESILSKEMKEQMLKQHVTGKYSYGWFVRERGGIWDVYWHKGNLPGFSSFISRRVQKNQFIVILSNAEDAALSEIENSINKILKNN